MSVVAIIGGLLTLLLQLFIDWRKSRPPVDRVQEVDRAIDSEFEADRRLAIAARLRELSDKAERNRPRG